MKWCLAWAVTIAVALGMTGCSSNQSNKPAAEGTKDSPSNETVVQSTAEVESEFFEKPFLLEADGEIIRMESPGYACPTMADVDGDGKDDLVVGQFRNGNLMFFKNIADTDQSPKFAKGEWLMAGTERVQVPGVW
jgi:hypothetical protein